MCCYKYMRLSIFTISAHINYGENILIVAKTNIYFTTSALINCGEINSIFVPLLTLNVVKLIASNVVYVLLQIYETLSIFTISAHINYGENILIIYYYCSPRLLSLIVAKTNIYFTTSALINCGEIN